MIGITGIIVITRMTTKASSWRIGKGTIVALRTIIRNTCVSTSQYIKLVMVESGRFPGVFTVAIGTIT